MANNLEPSRLYYSISQMEKATPLEYNQEHASTCHRFVVKNAEVRPQQKNYSSRGPQSSLLSVGIVILFL